MILSTTHTIEGKQIYEYLGVVFGEVITGVNFIKDFGASIRDFFGGRSTSYERELVNARDKAIEELQERAIRMGADAIVGIDVDYQVLGAKSSMMMIIVSGTAVRVA